MELVLYYQYALFVLIVAHSSVTASLPIAHAHREIVRSQRFTVLSSIRENLTMSKFEVPANFGTSNEKHTDNAISQIARQAWSPFARQSVGEGSRQLDSQLSSGMSVIHNNDAALNSYLNAVKEAGITSGSHEKFNDRITFHNERTTGGDSRLDRVQVVRSDRSTVSVREYRGLDASYTNDRVVSPDAKHRAPDATVIIPKGFDPDKPIRIVVFNHGLRGSGAEWAERSRLAGQMAAADPNTIMVIPEWQNNPTAKGGPNPETSRVYQPNFFRNQLQEIFNNTPELKGKRVDDIESMGIIAHSAGGRAAMAQLNDNGFGDKVTSVTVLDAMYKRNQYDKWIQANAPDLVSGRKQFTVFYQGDKPTDDQRLRRQVMEDECRKALGPYQVPFTCYDQNGTNVRDIEALERGGVVFMYDGQHDMLPQKHIGRILEVERRRMAGRR